MTLADLRKLSIKQQFRIRFVLPNGMECVITQHGIAQVPALKGVPDFNLEQDLASVGEFLLEPANRADPKRPQSRTVTRAELAAMTNSASAQAHDDHEEE